MAPTPLEISQAGPTPGLAARKESQARGMLARPSRPPGPVSPPPSPEPLPVEGRGDVARQSVLGPRGRAPASPRVLSAPAPRPAPPNPRLRPLLHSGRLEAAATHPAAPRVAAFVCKHPARRRLSAQLAFGGGAGAGAEGRGGASGAVRGGLGTRWWPGCFQGLLAGPARSPLAAYLSVPGGGAP